MSKKPTKNYIEGYMQGVYDITTGLMLQYAPDVDFLRKVGESEAAEELEKFLKEMRGPTIR